MRRLPPFTAIRAFEAAARHLSFKIAAEELCVTQSAVSHQIRILEDYLSTELFVRSSNQVSLTLTGKSYVGKLTSLLDSLDQSTREVLNPNPKELRILATPGFAARWLVPRLSRLSFCQDIRLRVSNGAPNTDFSQNDADIIIHWADSAVPGLRVEPLMSSVRYPVANADFIKGNKLKNPEDLLGLTLFRDEIQDGWAEWFNAADVELSKPLQGPQFPHCELASTAAEQGQGVALAHDAIIQDTLTDGRLIRLFDVATLPATIYSVAYQQDRIDEPRIRRFRDWIFAEVRAKKDTRPVSLTAVG